jgi:hypothetical protein
LGGDRLKVCDRCGRKIEPYGSVKLEEKLRRFAEWSFAMFILRNVDLCEECMDDFFKTFYPKVQALDEEVKRWMKGSRS